MATVAIKGDGYVTEITEGGSQLRWAEEGDGDTPKTLLPPLIARLREINRRAAARELSLAITHSEEALHWLIALEGRTNHGQ